MSKELCDTNRCHYQVGNIDRRSLIPLLGAGTAFLMLAGKALAQQVPIPTTAAQVPGPASGTAMTTAYVQSVGRMAYLWGLAAGQFGQPLHRLFQGARARLARRSGAGRIQPERNAYQLHQPG